MQTVSIQIPAELYTAIYALHKESTSEVIGKCLQSLIDDNKADCNSSFERVDYFTQANERTITGNVTRPGKGTITGKVWDIADQLLKETGEMNRTAVVTACIDAGINMNTANTQYSHWKNAVEQS